MGKKKKSPSRPARKAQKSQVDQEEPKVWVKLHLPVSAHRRLKATAGLRGFTLAETVAWLVSESGLCP